MFYTIKNYSELLELWCNSLLKLQITDMKTDGIYGGIICPLCSRIHGRCSDAIYPFMYMADRYNNDRYLDAAIKLFNWSNHVSRSDGSFINETFCDWKGITVFSTFQLGEAIRNHGTILDRDILSKWISRLRSAAEFLYNFITISVGNINYPIACSAAMVIAGKVLDEPRYILRGRQLAHNALEYLTVNHIIFGEGKPQNGITPGGCRAVDLGYNVEESLPGLVIYGLLTNDNEVLDIVTEALKEHLEFMLPDGAWDNSWGTRNYKWTYWGSRTSDGCQMAYALLKDRNPIFAEAAFRNTLLLNECTHDGILYGGPHNHTRGVLPCIHHTFSHAKALAAVLDHNASSTIFHSGISLPREKSCGVREYPEMKTWLVSIGQWRATVTAYDWEYIKEGHASGGAITMLWHEKAGVVLCGSMTEYQTVDMEDMPIPEDIDKKCLTPRLEFQKYGVSCFRNINDFDAEVKYLQNKNEIQFLIKGKLVDKNHKNPETGEIGFEMKYAFRHDYLEIQASIESSDNIGDIVYHMPVISECHEKVVCISNNCIAIDRRSCSLVIESDGALGLPDNIYNGGRIFNLVPGFEAVPILINVTAGYSTKLTIKVLPK